MAAAIRLADPDDVALQPAVLSAHAFSGTGSFAGSDRDDGNGAPGSFLVASTNEDAVDYRAYQTRNMLALALVFTVYFAFRSGCLCVLPLASKYLLRDALDGAVYSPLYQLPLALWFVMDMLIATPNAFFMERFGRSAGFLLGSVAAFSACVSAFLVLTFASSDVAAYVLLLVLIMPMSLIGMAEFVKYAAAEACMEESRRARTVSRVITGGAVLSMVGPGSSSVALLMEPDNPRQGYANFLLIMGSLSVLAIIASALMKLPPMVRTADASATDPLLTILGRPNVHTAIFAQVAVQFTMVTPMSATPLAMVHHIGLEPGSFVVSGCIIAHVLSMFLPGLVTGDIVGKVGKFPVMGVGILLQALCMVVTLSGYRTLNFYIGLILLGMGWNFAFVSSTMLLLSSHSSQERTRVTSFNETFRFAANAVASILSSTLQWPTLCSVCLGFLFLVTLSSACQYKRQQRA